jgi:hypothetical protein
VSVGAAQAQSGRDADLAHLLEHAKEAMVASMREGGNRVTCTGREQGCLPS